MSTKTQNTAIQREDIESYVRSRGWSNIVYYEDKLSGTTARRPALKNLMDDVRARKLDVVICWKLDRIARSIKDLVSMLQEFSDLRVDFVSLKDQIDMTTAAGRLLTHLLGAFAEFEASLIRERVMAGLRHAQENGVRLGRPKKISNARVLALRSQGLSMNAIAVRLGITKGAVSKTLKKIRTQTTEISGAKESAIEVEKTLDLETSDPVKRGQS